MTCRAASLLGTARYYLEIGAGAKINFEFEKLNLRSGCGSNIWHFSRGCLLQLATAAYHYHTPNNLSS
jgi:hypothetical protein